jgi:hypothetical protein
MQFHTKTSGPSEAGFRAGFLRAATEAVGNGTNEILLTTHALDNLEGVITSVFGEATTKALKKARLATFNGVTVFLETERIRSRFTRGVAFAPFVSSRLLNSVSEDPRATDVVYVPWAPSELAAYVQDNPASVELPAA